MKTDKPAPQDMLERLFHEPNRLAIMSALCAADGGLTFVELKASCNLTDGNLSRHLKALEEAKAIRTEKAFVGVKPRTTVYLSTTGLDRFRDYLDALADVLEKARQSVPEAKAVPASGRLARVRT